MEQVPDFLKKEVEEEKEIPSDTIKALTKLAGTLSFISEEIKKYEYEIKYLKEEYDKIAKEKIPAIMDEVGTNLSLTLKDGKTLTVKEMIYASMPKKDPVKRKKCLDMLFDLGYGDAVKDTVTINAGKGKSEVIETLMEMAFNLDHEMNIERKEDIHPQTFKKIVREMAENGVNFDRELVGYYQESVAVIK